MFAGMVFVIYADFKRWWNNHAGALIYGTTFEAMLGRWFAFKGTYPELGYSIRFASGPPSGYSSVPTLEDGGDRCASWGNVVYHEIRLLAQRHLLSAGWGTRLAAMLARWQKG